MSWIACDVCGGHESRPDDGIIGEVSTYHWMYLSIPEVGKASLCRECFEKNTAYFISAILKLAELRREARKEAEGGDKEQVS